MKPRKLPIFSAEEARKFWSRVRIGHENECWPWTAGTSQRKHSSMHYGLFKTQGRSMYTHRIAYELSIGPIPEGLTLDHLCHTPLCANPKHLEPVTLQENLRRRTGDLCPKRYRA